MDWYRIHLTHLKGGPFNFYVGTEALVCLSTRRRGRGDLRRGDGGLGAPAAAAQWTDRGRGQGHTRSSGPRPDVAAPLLRERLSRQPRRPPVRVAVEESESGKRPPGSRASGAPPRGPPEASGAGPTDLQSGPLFVIRRGGPSGSLCLKESKDCPW